MMHVYRTPLLFISPQYTYKQSQSNFIYIRDSISFLHDHEVESFGNRCRRQHTYNGMMKVSVALALYTFLCDYYYLATAY